MFGLCAFATPGNVRAPISVEEPVLDDRPNAVNLRQGEQKTQDFDPALLGRSAAQAADTEAGS